MSRVEVELLVDLLDQAFQRPLDANWADGWHSLQANLQNVRDEDWRWVAPGGVRTIGHITLHCGAAMRMYADHGFGPATLQWDKLPRPPDDAPKAEVMPWLDESYRILRDAVASVSDDDLAEERKTHFDLPKPRRWFVRTMIEHILYHAGEINYIRALAQGNDD